MLATPYTPAMTFAYFYATKRFVHRVRILWHNINFYLDIPKVVVVTPLNSFVKEEILGNFLLWHNTVVAEECNGTGSGLRGFITVITGFT